jgi:hypothetical protein
MVQGTTLGLPCRGERGSVGYCWTSNLLDNMRRVPLDIDENDDITGVKTISIVSDPAIESNFVVMARQQNLTIKKLTTLILRAFEMHDMSLIDRIARKMGVTRGRLHSLTRRIHRVARLRQQGFQLQE